MMITAAAATMYRVVEEAALLAGCDGVGATKGETVDVGAGVPVDDGVAEGVVMDAFAAALTPNAISAYEA
jgi:hypothetical protein